jgi:diaminohydroxyphosphoribosylaminopyrimidine deaminase/5-amino-6-(5-phosphoribosylamino)uracil reductase
MDRIAKDILDRCARAALRGRGHVEPGVMVGCAITSPDGRLLGMGHYERFGGPHAEVHALRVCSERGEDVRGATVWVTLEPCGHVGRTPPCATALIEAGITKVVYARGDRMNGGGWMLREAGIEVVQTGVSELAIALSEPFVMRAVNGRPWVTVKWAQSIDGKVATRGGDSQWISNARSRKMVHRMRGRMDVILTGIGTVLADDPLLTARGVRVRRLARRVVIDPDIRTPPESAIVESALEGYVGLVVDPDVLDGSGRERAAVLQSRGVELQAASMREGRVDLRVVLSRLEDRIDATNVMVEAGAGLVGALYEQDLIDEFVVFTAPFALGDAGGMDPVRGPEVSMIAHPARMTLTSVRRIGDDVMTGYRRAPSTAGGGADHLV